MDLGGGGKDLGFDDARGARLHEWREIGALIEGGILRVKCCEDIRAMR